LLSNTKFSGLISLCKMPFSWRYSSATIMQAEKNSISFFKMVIIVTRLFLAEFAMFSDMVP